MKPELTPAELRILHGLLRNPSDVAAWLDDIQHTACAAILRFPKLAKECTAHLFDSPDGFYLAVYRAIVATNYCTDDAYAAFSRKIGTDVWAERFAELLGHPVTETVGRMKVEQLKQFVAWKYRQQKRAA